MEKQVILKKLMEAKWTSSSEFEDYFQLLLEISKSPEADDEVTQAVIESLNNNLFIECEGLELSELPARLKEYIDTIEEIQSLPDEEDDDDFRW